MALSQFVQSELLEAIRAGGSDYIVREAMNSSSGGAGRVRSGLDAGPNE